MLYTATVRSSKPAPIYPFHDERLPSHGELAPGARVSVSWEDGDWRLVAGDHRAGWIRAAALRKDPMLLADVFWQDLGATPRFAALAAHPGAIGCVLKATEGAKYKHANWFVSNWPRVEAAARERYGTSWFRGAYHFWRADVDPIAQADYYLATVRRAGGWGRGDLLPIVDVEGGGDGHPNREVSAAKLIASVEAWVARVKKQTGRDVILYGRGLMRDLGISDRMGCRYLWDPQYGPELSWEAVRRVGFDVETTPLWQYSDGKVGATKTAAGSPLPRSIQGWGATDMSVVLLPTLADVKSHLVEGC